MPAWWLLVPAHPSYSQTPTLPPAIIPHLPSGWVGLDTLFLTLSGDPQSAILRTPPVDISIAWDSWILVTAAVWIENFKND